MIGHSLEIKAKSAHSKTVTLLLGCLALAACAGEPGEDSVGPQPMQEKGTPEAAEYPAGAHVIHLDKDLPFEEVLQALASDDEKLIHSFTCSEDIHYGIRNWATGRYMSMRADGGNAVLATADVFDAWEDFRLCYAPPTGNVPGGYALWSREANSFLTAHFDWGSSTRSYDGNPYGELVASGATKLDNWEFFQLKNSGAQGYALVYNTATNFLFASARYDYSGANYGMVRAGVKATVIPNVGFTGDDTWEHWIFEPH